MVIIISYLIPSIHPGAIASPYPILLMDATLLIKYTAWSFEEKHEPCFQKIS